MGGGAGSWLAQRRALGKEDSQVNTLAGFAGAYGGLFSSTVIVVLLILEVARPGGQRFTKALAAEIVASSVSFGIYFAIAGAVFLDDYQVPSYTVRGLAAARRDPPGPVRGPGGDAAGRVHDGSGAAVRPAQGPGHREINAGRRGVRDRRRGTAADDVLRQRSAQDRTQRRGDARPRPARRHPDRQDAHLRRQPGQRLRRRADLPLAVHRRNRRGPRPPGHPRRATWDWRSPACSPPSPGRSRPRRSPWC